MLQQFKSLYFSDFPAVSPKQRNLKIAFSAAERDLFNIYGRRSSEEIRCILGFSSFNGLRAAAASSGLSLNAYCIHRLREAVVQSSETAQLQLPEINIDSELGLDPIQATFRGAKGVPLHNWYPYLEGYSPEFVDNLIDTYTPDANHILDPFAGSGTTPLTAAMRGLRASYCELNPLLQFLIEAKSTILCRSEKARNQLASKLEKVSAGLRANLPSFPPDKGLLHSYERTFGKSEFFHQDTYDTILRLRSWLDFLVCSDRDLFELATVAILACLIPASNLIRRGDLRFRRGDAEKRLISRDLVGDVVAKIAVIAEDLLKVKTALSLPALVIGNARRIDRIPNLKVNAVITSPPYLNGTNYYRNTKLELWFLRSLRSTQDLSAFRLQTVAAGINDVTHARNITPASNAIANVAEELRTHAYDPRIAMMILSYFSDMKAIFHAIRSHSDRNTQLLIDIGDSAYAGVHVDTPKIIAEILESDGWKLRRDVTLRRRLSRNGFALRQTLLVFTSTEPTPKIQFPEIPWQKKWDSFKSGLPHQSDSYAKRNWGHPLHSLCSFQGKMKPSLAHHLVDTFVHAGHRFLDPFGGVGTIPFEAASKGATAWSFDLSPAAVVVAKAKLEPTSHKDVMIILQNLTKYLGNNAVLASDRNEADMIKFNGRIALYFHPKTYAEILLARRFFLENPPTSAASALVFSSLLHILHGNRPYALSRRSHPLTPFAPTGETVYKSVISKINEKIDRVLANSRPGEFVQGFSCLQDATDSWPTEVDNLDVVVTSPPFFESTRFHSANWMRIWFAGWTAKDFKERPAGFVDERQKKSFDVYQPVLRQARERLRGGGVCVLHLGKSRKCDMAAELSKEARRFFQHAEIFYENVEHCESHGIRDKGSVFSHSYVVCY